MNEETDTQDTNDRPLAATPSSQTMKFRIPGLLKRRGRRKPEHVDLYLDAEDREEARWQAHHGVIHARIARDFPGASIKYDLRKMRRHF